MQYQCYFIVFSFISLAKKGKKTGKHRSKSKKKSHGKKDEKLQKLLNDVLTKVQSLTRSLDTPGNDAEKNISLTDNLLHVSSLLNNTPFLTQKCVLFCRVGIVVSGSINTSLSTSYREQSLKIFHSCNCYPCFLGHLL